MQYLLVLIAALAPVAILLWYIFKKDRTKPEPTNWLAKAFWYGVLSAFLSFAFSTPLGAMFGSDIDAEVYPSIFNSFADAFLMAAIPEELAKLIMLWLLLRKNPHFDERFDGIVYAVCIGMGFAGIENVLYLFGGIEDGSWLSTGIVRALFSVPGHFLFAVLMGYYYSIYYWGIDRSMKAKAMILAAPILAHGIFDGILFCIKVDDSLVLISFVAFIYFFNKLRKKGKERLEELMDQ